VCSLQAYAPPEWIKIRHLQNVPTHRYRLGNFPTPLEHWTFVVNGKQYRLLIKRDDLSDMSASGNKIRKLEFIFPHVISNSHDMIVSVGGTQSNHCRSVSAVSARIGIPSAHVLRKDPSYREDRPTEGNLLFHKLFNSTITLVDRSEYIQKGSDQLLKEFGAKLVAEGKAKNPFLLPVGGSTIHGVFGYIEFIHELEKQLTESGETIDDIFFSCGSGGTAAGLAIGKYLCDHPVLKKATLTGYLACDSPSVFYEHINEMILKLGVLEDGKPVQAESLIRFVQAKGVGYSMNTPEETSLIHQVAASSGIVLDGTYTGKAVNGFVNEGRQEGIRSLFVHTGGIFSLFGNL